MMNQILSIIVIAVPYIVVFVLYWVLFSAARSASNSMKQFGELLDKINACKLPCKSTEYFYSSISSATLEKHRDGFGIILLLSLSASEPILDFMHAKPAEHFFFGILAGAAGGILASLYPLRFMYNGLFEGMPYGSTPQNYYELRATEDIELFWLHLYDSFTNAQRKYCIVRTALVVLTVASFLYSIANKIG